MLENNYYVYIKTDENHKLHDIGFSHDIIDMLLKQQAMRSGLVEPNQDQDTTFAHISQQQLLCAKLVYYEHGHQLATAYERCQRLRKMPPSKRRRLIDRYNPEWRDLSQEWLT